MGSLAEQFGKQVRQRRKARGLTQAQLAEAASMSEEWVRRIERGAGSPSFDAIEVLAEALGVSVADLFSTMTKSDERAARVSGLFAGLTDPEQDWLEGVLRTAAARPRH